MEKSAFKVYVIRPYHIRIREKVFAAIKSLGGIVPDGWIAPEDATDAEVLLDLRDKRPDVLLAPFHIGRDKNDNKVHGLQTVGKIIDEYLWAEALPVLMPTSIFGKAAFEIDLPQFAETRTTEKILVLEEDDLDDPDLAKKIWNHIGRQF